MTFLGEKTLDRVFLTLAHQRHSPLGKPRNCSKKFLEQLEVGSHSTRGAGAPLAHGLRPAYTNDMNALIAGARRMAMIKGRSPASKGMCVVYFLRLRSGGLYSGASEDLGQRLDDHGSGQACRTTHLDPPVSVLRIETFSTFSEARLREVQLKRWSRAKKEALLSGELEQLHTLGKSREIRIR